MVALPFLLSLFWEVVCPPACSHRVTPRCVAQPGHGSGIRKLCAAKLGRFVFARSKRPVASVLQDASARAPAHGCGTRGRGPGAHHPPLRPLAWPGPARRTRVSRATRRGCSGAPWPRPRELSRPSPSRSANVSAAVRPPVASSIRNPAAGSRPPFGGSGGPNSRHSNLKICFD